MRKRRGTLPFLVVITAGLSCALVACSDLRSGRWLGTLDAVDSDAGVTDVADTVGWPDDGRDPGNPPTDTAVTDPGATQDPGFQDSVVDVATDAPDTTGAESDAWEATDEGVDAIETFDDGIDLPMVDVPPTCVSSDQECLDRIPLGPCQKAHCNTRAGICVAIEQDDATPCDDGNACTVGDQCIQGACVGGPGREDCGGTNPCVVYGCDPAVGCTLVLLDSGDCDPGLPCMVNGRCEVGECVGDPDPACQCPSPDWDCSAHEDGLRCNGLLQCDRDPVAPTCILDETTVITCDGLLDTDCLKNLCLEPDGECDMTPVREGLPCNEWDPCIFGASCEEGLCVGGEPVLCDDGNPCTSDSCDPLVGCMHFANAVECAPARCQEGTFYPTASCSEKACPSQVGESCDDGNECTDDGCDPLDGCLHSAVLDGRVCGWDDACAVAMVCLNGACVLPEEGPCVALSLAVGDRHTCILASTGTVKCWGHNDQGQLGLGDKAHRGDAADEMGTALPGVDLGTGQTPTAVGSGSNHTCALLLGGRIKCWGGNEWGQLGLGDKVHRGDGPGEMGDDLPHVNLGTDIKATAISVGSGHTCALLEGGGVKCWGAGWSGALGLGDGANRGDDGNEMGDSLPTIDLGLDRTAVAISAGPGRSCAILDNGQLKCWGNNSSGALGLGDTMSRGNAPDQMGENLPAVDLGTGHTATAVSTNANHTCAILETGQVKCWGRNSDCQLGLGDGVDRGDQSNEMGELLPTINLGTDRTAVAITGGQYFTCAHLDNAQVKCWGNNIVGSLGTGTGKVTLGCNPAHMGDNLPAVALGEGRVAMDVAGGAGGFSGLHACAPARRPRT